MSDMPDDTCGALFPQLHQEHPPGYYCRGTARAAFTFVILIILITIAFYIKCKSIWKSELRGTADTCLSHAAFVSCLTLLIQSIIFAGHGGFDDWHYNYLTCHWWIASVSRAKKSLKLQYFGIQANYYLAIFLIKTSLLSLYFRAFTNNRLSLLARFKGKLGVLLILNTFWLMIWNCHVIWLLVTDVQTHLVQAQAKDMKNRLIVGGYMNAFSDLCLFMLPLWALWHLKLQRKDMVTLASILILGSLATVASIVQSIMSGKILQDDYSLARGYLARLLAITIEASLGYVCLCLPAFQDFFIKSGLVSDWYNMMRSAWVRVAWLGQARNSRTAESLGGRSTDTVELELVSKL